MTTLKTIVQNRRIDIPAPSEYPDGTEVILTIGTQSSYDQAMSAEEIAHVLAAMRQLPPLDIPADTASDLDAWERQINEHGIQGHRRGISMTRFILDTGIAGLYLDRKRGVFERAEIEVAKGNRLGIAAPVLTELA